jgi:hypothetical protein
MTDQPQTNADPLGTPPPPAQPDASSATSTTDPSTTDPRDAVIAELQDAVAQLQSQAGTPATAAPSVPGAAGTSAPAAVAPGVPAHAMAADLDDVEVGDLLRYVYPSLDGTTTNAGYGLVLDVVEVDDGSGGSAVDGQPSHVEVVVATLDVLGRRLTAADVVDLEASSALHEQQG